MQRVTSQGRKADRFAGRVIQSYHFTLGTTLFLLCKELNGEEQEAIHIYFEHNLENKTH